MGKVKIKILLTIISLVVNCGVYAQYRVGIFPPHSVRQHAESQEQYNSKDQDEYSEPATVEAIATEFSKAEQDPTFWPGFNIAQRPIVTYICQSNCHLYAFYFTPQNKIWQKQVAANKVVYYSPTDPYGVTTFEEASNNLLKNIDGQASFVLEGVYPDSENGYSSLGVVLLHYMLTDAPNAKQRLEKAIQSENTPYNGFAQTINVVYLYLESQLLNDYLNSLDEDQLKNAAAIEQVRRSVASKETLLYEDNNSHNYFLAYPFMKLGTYNEYLKILSSQAPRELDDIFCDDCRDINYLDSAEDTVTFIDDAVIFGLNKVEPNWKTMMNAEVISPKELLLRHYSMSNEEAKRRVDAIKSRYGFDATINKVDAKMQPYLAQVKEQQDRYQSMPGIVVHFLKFLYADDNHVSNTYHVDTMNTVFQSKAGDRVSIGENEQVEVESLSYIWKRGYYRSNAMYEAKLPPDAIVIIDGKQNTVAGLISAKRQWKFRQMTLMGNDFYNGPMSITIKLKRPGKIDTTQGTLDISK